MVVKTTEVLEENTGENIFDTGSSRDLLHFAVNQSGFQRLKLLLF